MKVYGRLFLGTWLCLASLTAQAQAKEGNWLKRTVNSVLCFIDSATVKGIDPTYINVPERPWQLMVKYNANRMDLRMQSHFDDPDEGYELDLEPRLQTSTSHNVGLWIGYRGYGIGYSKGIGTQSGYYFTAGATGGSYGINLRLRTFSTDDIDVHMVGRGVPGYGAGGGNGPFNRTETAEMDEPIRVRSLFIDGYYLFNGRHFSYTAAYDQSAIQLRSAGSLLVGGMWHNTTLRYNDDRNAAFVGLMHNIGVIKIRQGSLGVGYAYNWVPTRGLLVSALAMPMLTVYNRQVVELYDVAVDDESEDTDTDFIAYRESVRHTSNMTLTFDARLSVTYNWDRYFINAYGQWNHFRYSHDEGGNGRINDWFINASLGVRF